MIKKLLACVVVLLPMSSSFAMDKLKSGQSPLSSSQLQDLATKNSHLLLGTAKLFITPYLPSPATLCGIDTEAGTWNPFSLKSLCFSFSVLTYFHMMGFGPTSCIALFSSLGWYIERMGKEQPEGVKKTNVFDAFKQPSAAPSAAPTGKSSFQQLNPGSKVAESPYSPYKQPSAVLPSAAPTNKSYQPRNNALVTPQTPKKMTSEPFTPQLKYPHPEPNPAPVQTSTSLLDGIDTKKVIGVGAVVGFVGFASKYLYDKCYKKEEPTPKKEDDKSNGQGNKDNEAAGERKLVAN